MRRSLLALLAACAALGVGARQTSAEQPAPDPAAMPAQLVLRKSDCSPLPFDEVALASRLRVELAEAGVSSIIIESPVDAASAGRERGATVTLLEACSGGALTVVITNGEEPGAQGSVDVSEMAPGVRERALALAIAGLLRKGSSSSAAGNSKRQRASDIDSASSAPARPNEVLSLSADATPAERDNADLPRPPRRELEGAPTLLSAGIEWRFLFQQNTALTGGRLAVSVPAGRRWLVRASAEAGAFYDSEDNGARPVELWLITGAVGISGGYGWARAEVALGPRLELGFGHTSAALSEIRGEPQKDSAEILIASMVSTGRVRVRPRLWLSMDLEIGHVLRGLSAPALDRAPLGIRGTTGGGRLGVALEL